jgi:uncharacterized protein (DUF58 family)
VPRSEGTPKGENPLKKSFAPYAVDWGAFAPLKLRARIVAEGVYAGMHRSMRKGAGVEFGGQRPYVPGDDLRFFDRRALLRHDKMMIREFETETDRSVWLMVDATASMSYRGSGPGAKYAFASLLAAALARVALASGDPVGMVIFGGEDPRTLPPASGREAFERVVWALSKVNAMGDLAKDDRAFERAILPVAEHARRGSMVVLFSDLFDLPERARSAFSSLAVRGRIVHAVEVLDPDERTLPFKEQARFRALEGGSVIDADPELVRAEYIDRLDAISRTWSRDLIGRGGGLVRTMTNDPPVHILRQLCLSLSGIAQSQGGGR